MKRLLILFPLIGLILIFAIVALGLFTFDRVLHPQIEINTTIPAVVKQLQSLNRLETASFTIEKVITAGSSGNAFQQLLFGDKILLIAHGQVIAGFDLSQVGDKDVAISGSTLHITLPAPQILITKLDNSQTQVYDRRVGIFTKGDKDLESQARLAAEQSITKAACTDGILHEASKNGQNQLNALFKMLHFTTVTIIIPNGSC